MDNISPFIDKDYNADRNIVGHYHDQMATYIAKTKDVPYEKAREILAKYINPNNSKYKDKKIQVLKKNKYGDREVGVMNISDFFSEVQDNDYHLSASLVGYVNSEKEESINAIGTKLFIDQRNHYKAQRQEARKVGDTHLIAANNELQEACKLFNNAQSGAMSSEGTPLNNKTGHTSLTATCMVLTSTVNMINEQLLAGNRYYNSYTLTLESLLSRLTYTDMSEMAKVIEQFGMEHATVDQVRAMLVKSTKFYWTNKDRFRQIMDFVKKLNPIELTTILCVLDLQGLCSSNEKVLKELFDDFTKIPEIPNGLKEGDFIAPDNKDRYILCISKLTGDATKLQINSLNQHHLDMEVKWENFIRVFLKAEIPPTNIYEIRNMIRDVVLTSDTDSSIYSTDKVVNRHTNTESDALKLNGVLTYFIRMIAIHQHAQVSSNINVSKKNMFELTMKNEYLYGSYVNTPMAKNYFATQLMVEGVMNCEINMEIKGGHLRSSKIAIQIRDFAHKLMRDVLDAIYSRTLLDAADLLFNVAELEREITKDIKAGSYKWLARNTIKDEIHYANPDSSIHQYHKLWESVFSNKYGSAPEPPYSAYKLNTTLNNKTAIATWIAQVGDVNIATKMTEFMANKKDLSSFYIPVERMPTLKVLPSEMIQAADIRVIIKQNLKSVYAVLDSLGLFIINNNISRLVSDEH